MTGAKVLLAIGSSDIGGGQKVFLSFAQELHRRGVPAVAVMPEGPLVQQVRPYVETIHIADLTSVRSLPAIARILREERAEIINTYLTKCGLLFSLVNLFFRRRLYCTLLNAVTHEALGPLQCLVYPALYWVLHRLSDGIIVNSRQNKQHLVEAARMDPERVKVIYSGIDIEGFAGQRPRRAPNDEFVIGAVGRLSPEKGQLYLVRAMAHLRHINCVCLLVGDGPMRQELEGVAKQENVADRIRFLGFRESIAEIMNDLDVVVVPSINETFGITIVEAFALRKMIIASDVGGIPELVRNGQTGLLVPAKDSGALAAAIEHAFTHRSECERMGQTGYEFAVASFTTAAMAGNTLGYFGFADEPAPKVLSAAQ